MNSHVLLFFSSHGFTHSNLHEHYNTFTKDIGGVLLKAVIGKLDKDGFPIYVRIDYNKQFKGLYPYQKLVNNLEQIINSINNSIK